MCVRLDGEFPVAPAAHGRHRLGERDADWLQAEQERREEERRFSAVPCCDVSSLLQHGAPELKNLGHYILLSGIHPVHWTRRSGLGQQRVCLCIPEVYSSHSLQLGG